MGKRMQLTYLALVPPMLPMVPRVSPADTEHDEEVHAYPVAKMSKALNGAKTRPSGFGICSSAYTET